jgi:aspartyl-tRNA(Asn)/glutamyl-tRNA(Gln) amidotransferase subunit C
MNISDIENLAELAKIGLTDEEKENLLKDLDSILGYIKQIREVKTDEIIPEDENGNVWREDNPSARQDLAENFSREKIVEQFPDAKDGFVNVKKIL